MREKRVREEVVQFGPESQLVGLLHPARPVDEAQRRVGVIMLTAGMLPSPGPFRLHTELAVALGQCGISSLRFDLSGIGESLAYDHQGSSLERASAEIGCAIETLENELGCDRVILFGICSGADDALYAAQHHEAVTGIFSVDGCGYRTLPFYWHRVVSNYLPKLLNAEKWYTRARQIFGLKVEVPSTLHHGDDIREFPAPLDACDQLLGLASRGVRMHFHYTGGVSEYYNYRNQFLDMFPQLEEYTHVTTSFAPASDHVAFLCEHREELIQLATRTIRGMVQSTSSQENPVAPIIPTMATASPDSQPSSLW